MTPTTDSLVIETQLVNIPNVGAMFRRVHRTPGGEELMVEYMEVYDAGSIPLPDGRAEEAVCGMAAS